MDARDHQGANAPRSPEALSNWELLRRLFGLGWRYRAGCVKLAALQMLRVAISLIGLSFVGLGIDVVRQAVDSNAAEPRFPLGWQPPSDWSAMQTIIAIAGGIAAFAAVQSLLRRLAELTAARLVEGIVIRLRDDVYRKLQRLSFRFFDTHETGSIINRVAGDVQAVRMFVDGVMVQIVIVVLSLGVFLSYMLRIHVGLTLACLATTPLLWLSAVVFSRLVRPQYVRNRELVDSLIRTLTENVQGISVVKGFAREPEEIAKFAAANNAVCDHKRSIFWKVSLFTPVMAFLTNINMVVLLGYGGYLIIHDQLRLGEGLFVFAGLLQRFGDQVSQITEITNRIQTSLTGAQRVFEVLDAPIEIDSPANALPLRSHHAPRDEPNAESTPDGHSAHHAERDGYKGSDLPVRGEITFDHVWFEYEAGRPVLCDVAFTVPAGSCVAIVGATGSGKSTLLSLLPRLYDVTAGRVLLDGVDVRQFNLDDLRRSVGVVFQESFLFSNTVASNIVFGRPEASIDEMRRAARIADAEEFIGELPQTYDTVIGEYGANLSGGQRQRLALARAVLTRPSVLILDDATSAVDPTTEQQILDALDSELTGRTVFLVAHRLSTLRRADLIVVLDQGRVAQVGTHDELFDQDGHYREAALLQLGIRGFG